MFDHPPSGDWALACLVVGALFLVRFLLMVRRIRHAAGRTATGSVWDDAGRVTTVGAFGREFEPERRHAVRLFVVGALFSVVGLALAGWGQVAAFAAPLSGPAGTVSS